MSNYSIAGRFGAPSSSRRVSRLSSVIVSALLVTGFSSFGATSVGAVGKTANTITAAKAPTSASVGGYFTPSATATSGDKVVINLDTTSTGCALNLPKVNFTSAGTCRVDYNDPGNATYAAATQVQQSITVHAANVITASKPPATGSVHGSYAPSATATSGDKVVITLDATSKGCTIGGSNKVTFTADGTCRIDFNDPGNGAYAAAVQVQQSILIGTVGHKAQAALLLTSTSGVYGKTLTLTSSGGSGTGAVSYAVTTIGTAGCSIVGSLLSATRVGTCTVTVTKAADATYASAHSSATTVTMVAHYASSPRAFKMTSAVWTGRSVLTSILGVGFYGQPRIISNVSGTRVGVLHDTGRTLSIRVTVATGTPRGVHIFTLIFAHGERTSVRYNQR